MEKIEQHHYFNVTKPQNPSKTFSHISSKLKHADFGVHNIYNVLCSIGAERILKKKTYRKQYEKILLLSTQIYWFDIVVGIKQITNVEEIQAWKKNDQRVYSHSFPLVVARIFITKFTLLDSFRQAAKQRLLRNHFLVYTFGEMLTPDTIH